MKPLPTLILSLIVSVGMDGCKPTVYTDAKGRQYYIDHVCVESHSEQVIIGYMACGDNPNCMPIYGTQDVCDSSESVIVYIH